MVLGRIGPDAKPAVAALVETMKDKNTNVRQLAVDALGRIGKELGLWSPFEANAPVSLAFPEPARPAGGA